MTFGAGVSIINQGADENDCLVSVVFGKLTHACLCLCARSSRRRSTGDEGDLFYVLDSGTCDCFVRKGGVEVKLKEYQHGDTFGELALMYNSPRKATIRVCTGHSIFDSSGLTIGVLISCVCVGARRLQVPWWCGQLIDCRFVAF